MNSEANKRPSINYFLSIKDVNVGKALEQCIETIVITIIFSTLLWAFRYSDMFMMIITITIMIIASAVFQFWNMVLFAKSMLNAPQQDKQNWLVLFAGGVILWFFAVTIYAALVFMGLVNL